MIENFNKNKYYYLGLIIIFISQSVFWLAGENAHYFIHDNFDAKFMNYVLVAKYFSESPDFIVPELFNGLPLFCLESKLFITSLFFLIFKPLVAYMLNDIIVKIVAYVGMYKLLDSIYDKSFNNKLIILIISLSFALLPFYSVYGISIAGVPLFLVCVYSIVHKKIITFPIVFFIIIFPFYSVFFLTGMYIVGGLGSIIFLYLILYKKLNKELIFIFVFLVLTYILVDYKLFFYFLGYDSIRSDFGGDSNLNIKELITSNLFVTQYHAARFSTIFVLVVSIIALFISKFKNRVQNGLFLILILSIFLIVIFEFMKLYLSDYKLILSLSFDRIGLFLPVLWFVLFANSLNILMHFTKFKQYDISNIRNIIVITIVSIQFILILNADSYYKDTLKELCHSSKSSIYSVSYKEFFMKDAILEITRGLTINTKEKVGAIGFYPTILNYNGYSTIGGYSTLYSKLYKKRFRKLIQNELQLDTSLKKYYDNWGGRAYVFSSEINKNNNSSKAINIYLNSTSYKDLNLCYLFSKFKFLNSKENRLILKNSIKINDSDSLYLYSVTN